MRIKFRGKRTDNGNLVHGFYYYHVVSGVGYIITQVAGRMEYHPVDSETVRQLVHDRGSMEFYEGDIVKTYGYDCKHRTFTVQGIEDAFDFLTMDYADIEIISKIGTVE